MLARFLLLLPLLMTQLVPLVPLFPHILPPLLLAVLLEWSRWAGRHASGCCWKAASDRAELRLFLPLAPGLPGLLGLPLVLLPGLGLGLRRRRSYLPCGWPQTRFPEKTNTTRPR